MTTDHDAALREGLGRVIEHFILTNDGKDHHGSEDWWMDLSGTALCYLTEAGVLLPVLPEGWHLSTVTQLARHEYEAVLWSYREEGDTVIHASGKGDPWQDALAAAIAAAIGDATDDR